MKYLIALLAVCLIFHRASAQTEHDKNVADLLKGRTNPEEPHLATKELANRVGSHIYIYDKISECKIINGSLKLLFIGGKYPNQTATIIIKGKKVNKELALLKKGNESHFSGTVTIYEGKPAIVILDQWQTSAEIQL